MTGAPLCASERGAGYLLLSAGLCYPQPAALGELLRDAAAEGGVVAEMAAALLPLLDDELPGEHNRLFAQGVAVSPYERSYLGGDLGVGLGQLAALYEAFGVRARGTEGGVPDHIGAELEFAGFLCLKEDLHRPAARAGDATAVEIVQAARRTFAQEHLLRWGGLFAARLSEQARHPYYQVLSELLGAFLLRDLTEHGWVAAPRLTRLPVVSAEDDAAELSCPMAESTPPDAAP